ncbi:hypothetical protein NPIL_198161 [Nephila pilipes]|uniref:Uncharacterized protein n=1 Tax=Nephila pilipes TaxID=299642 RepID=A0A8X6URT5_NEPPI|nr:hypothetical protein NPIL_198161 [Nephila pilipes]
MIRSEVSLDAFNISQRSVLSSPSGGDVVKDVKLFWLFRKHSGGVLDWAQSGCSFYLQVEIKNKMKTDAVHGEVSWSMERRESRFVSVLASIVGIYTILRRRKELQGWAATSDFPSSDGMRHLS